MGRGNWKYNNNKLAHPVIPDLIGNLIIKRTLYKYKSNEKNKKFILFINHFNLMRMKKLMILAVAAIALVACSRTFEKHETEGVAIGFGTWTETLTKGTVENSFEVGNTFNVWGEKLVGETHTDVFTSVTVRKTENGTPKDPGTWTYDNKQYWDLSASKYTFYAVSPAADGYTVDETTGAISASPTITFNGKDSDILVAQQAVVNKTDGGGNFNNFAAVPLVFNHVAALVDVKVKVAAGLVAAGATVQVSGISLLNISTEGTFTVAGGYTTAPAAVWTPSTAAAGTTASFDGADGYTDVSSSLNTNLNGTTGDILIKQLVVMPQDFRTTGDFIQKLDIDYNITQTGGTANNFTPDPFALTTFDNVDNETNTDTNVTGWAPGYHYTYVVTIDARKIEFTATISDWTPADNAYNYLIN